MSQLSVSAAGSTQVTATPISPYASFIQISVCTSAANGVCLPGAVTNSTLGNYSAIQFNFPMSIRNDGVSCLNVWPASGYSIDALAVNTAFCVPSGSVAVFTAISSSQWYAQLSGSAGLAISSAMTALSGGAQPALAANVIPVNQVYSLIGTCAAAKDSIALPDVPLLNQPYLVVNNGALTCALWPGLGTAASIIDNMTANLPFFLGAKARCSFTAVSNAAGVIQWYSSGYVGGKANVPITTTATLTNQHCNAIVSLTGTTYTVTLPALAAAIGQAIQFNFTAAVTAITIANPGGAHTRGGISAGSAVHATVADVTNVICTTMAIGDTLSFISDGTSYYLSGFIATTGNLTTS